MTTKLALVTGASKGIGLACARALSDAGYHIALHYRSNPELAEKLAESIPNCKAFQADLSDPEACQNLIKNVKNEMGSIDTLVNNAGISKDQIATFAKPSDFDELISTNLRPVFLLSKFASRMMIKKKQGQIINISSVVGHTGNSGQALYAATKGAITSFTMSMAQELASFGIRCNCVAPGFIQTEMTSTLPNEVQEAILTRIPMKRLGNSEEVANAVAFLASEKSSYITASTIHVNGGMHPN